MLKQELALQLLAELQDALVMELMVTIPYIIKSIKRAKMRERLRVAVQKKADYMTILWNYSTK